MTCKPLCSRLDPEPKAKDYLEYHNVLHFVQAGKIDKLFPDDVWANWAPVIDMFIARALMNPIPFHVWLDQSDPQVDT